MKCLHKELVAWFLIIEAGSSALYLVIIQK